ncbi:MAG: hypothetical protein P8100_10105 [bacterium]|jgi:hypothetical protein
MNDKVKNVLYWILAVAITLSLVIYQRATGPTYPLSGEKEVNGEMVVFEFLRSHDTKIDAPVELEVSAKGWEGILEYKRYKSYDEWTRISMKREGEKLTAAIPHQPAAGKVMYNVLLEKGGEEVMLNDEPVIIRFKGSVPGPVLAPHIFFMFLSLLFGIRAGIEALTRRKDTFYQVGVALLTVIIGGLILGPIVQKYAFDAYWTGWPFGNDLTDNKTALIFIFWLIAWWKLRKDRKHKTMVLVATFVMIIVYIIPHSVLGSEIDHTKSKTPETEIAE